jgi:hypothetical protein
VAWTNVTIPEMFSTEEMYRKKIHDLTSDLDYATKQVDRLLKEIMNIPEAVEKYGYVDISYGREKMTLIKKVDPST